MLIKHPNIYIKIIIFEMNKEYIIYNNNNNNLLHNSVLMFETQV